jgi:methylenetetrahydrofolate dehydrogenase (NADP+)/methenyltetrahydrofolate cyclohydrolase
MILEGKPLAEKIYQELKAQNRHPGLAVVLVGEDPASISYAKVKEKAAENLGAIFKLYHLPNFSTQEVVEKLISDLNQNKHIQGIVVQLPLPEDFDVDAVLSKISSEKDIDGFSGKFPAPTAQAILEILKFYKIDIARKKIVIVGHGRLVGRPLSEMLRKKGITPIICTSSSKISSATIDADIIVSATGEPGLIKPEMVSEKAVIIDAGTAESRGKIRGDVDASVYEKVSAYTPTPGGVGPVTVACLMKNLVEAGKNRE